MAGQRVPHDIYVHIAGIDIVRVDAEDFYVLEDNARTPSGVSYMLENREIDDAALPGAVSASRCAPVENYPELLRQSLALRRPPGGNRDKPTIAVLTPGIHNSAYYEHAFLADQMGVDLVEGSDLQVVDGHVHAHDRRVPRDRRDLPPRLTTTSSTRWRSGRIRVLGVPGIMDVYRAGNVTIANAPGTGIADDKAIYSICPRSSSSIRRRKSILENVPTWRCREAEQPEYVLDHLEELVVKEVHGSGGYGMLVGPAASKQEREDFRPQVACATRTTTSRNRHSPSRPARS